MRKGKTVGKCGFAREMRKRANTEQLFSIRGDFAFHGTSGNVWRYF